jgi:hypothetical protein
MKELSLEKMESLHGGGFMSGACAVFGLADMGVAAYALVGASLAIPGWGLAVLAGGTLACGAYVLLR